VVKDMVARVEEFIKKFNPPVPEIIQLRVWEELSFEEISEIMGKPVGSIKMAYYRALEKIQAEFMKA
jgi:RNA polymerase sigma factor (sigma-70 family)